MPFLADLHILTRNGTTMTEYWLELRATIETMSKSRVEAHRHCDALRYEQHGRVVWYDPTVHSEDCHYISRELLRLADILEFVEAPHTYNPGNLFREIETGTYNLRKRKVEKGRYGHSLQNCP